MVIVGPTAVGKTALSIRLAKKYNGEIINGDAMQLYEGLPIITNKMPEDERAGIPHHLLGCIGLNEETWTVGNFVSNALKFTFEGTIRVSDATGERPVGDAVVVRPR